MSAETGVTYPNFAGKHAQDSLFGPSDFLAYLRSIGKLKDFQAPESVIMCYQRSLYEHILATEGVERPDRDKSQRGVITLPRTDHRVGVRGNFGFGAPGASGALEELIALGATRIISVGTAGSLQPACTGGHLIVCERAVRDEGVSHHYLPPGKYSHASPRLTEGLRAELSARELPHTAGASWTIDALFRETVAEAAHYQSEGVLCVEMEAAALFGVGEYRGVQVASAFVVSDSLADGVWQPNWHSPDVSAGLVALYDAAVTVLSGGGAARPPEA